MRNPYLHEAVEKVRENIFKVENILEKITKNASSYLTLSGPYSTLAFYYYWLTPDDSTCQGETYWTGKD